MILFPRPSPISRVMLMGWRAAPSHLRGSGQNEYPSDNGIRRSCAAARGADIAARCPYHAEAAVRNTKAQTPSSREAPSSKLEPRAAVWSLELEISLVFGAWYLVIRAWLGNSLTCCAQTLSCP